MGVGGSVCALTGRRRRVCAIGECRAVYFEILAKQDSVDGDGGRCGGLQLRVGDGCWDKISVHFGGPQVTGRSGHQRIDPCVELSSLGRRLQSGLRFAGASRTRHK